MQDLHSAGARQGAPGTSSRSAACSAGARVAVAITWGVLCHVLFAVAIAAMVVGLHGGLLSGRGGLHGSSAALADGMLLLQFPLVHSFLLSTRGRRVLARLAPLGLGRDLATTTFGIAASLQLLAAFVLWSPSGVVLYAAEGALRGLFEIAFAASWALLVVALVHAGLALQTGFVGWSAVLRGERPCFAPFPEHGLFRACRQPVYLAFALTLWTGPVLTLDRLVLAAAWTAYCAAGPLLKERRYLARFGDAYRRYQTRVPYMLPRIPS